MGDDPVSLVLYTATGLVLLVLGTKAYIAGDIGGVGLVLVVSAVIALVVWLAMMWEDGR